MTEGISVVIPAHNEDACIARCLESVRTAERQCPAPVKIVVVVNRCKDRTEVISRGFGATVVAEHARNLAKIRNAGMRIGSWRFA